MSVASEPHGALLLLLRLLLLLLLLLPFWRGVLAHPQLQPSSSLRRVSVTNPASSF
jgi:hypothetical protein